jgi:hypothetical protein
MHDVGVLAVLVGEGLVEGHAVAHTETEDGIPDIRNAVVIHAFAVKMEDLDEVAPLVV